MSKANLGAGDVEIELNGETFILRPTVRAAQTISRQAGGISAAADAVMKFDIDVMASVITLGLSLPATQAADVGERVYRNGMSPLVSPVVRYLSILANGGRAPDSEVHQGQKNPPQK